MIFGKQDTHVPRAGRDLIRKSLEDANVTASVSYDDKDLSYGLSDERNAVPGGECAARVHPR